MKIGTLLAIVLLSLVSIGHLLRYALKVPVTIETWLVPQWISLVGIVVPAAIALLLYRESRQPR